jgi:hypothetical protein
VVELDVEVRRRIRLSLLDRPHLRVIVLGRFRAVRVVTVRLVRCVAAFGVFVVPAAFVVGAGEAKAGPGPAMVDAPTIAASVAVTTARAGRRGGGDAGRGTVLLAVGVRGTLGVAGVRCVNVWLRPREEGAARHGRDGRTAAVSGRLSGPTDAWRHPRPAGGSSRGRRR